MVPTMGDKTLKNTVGRIPEIRRNEFPSFLGEHLLSAGKHHVHRPQQGKQHKETSGCKQPVK